MSVIPSSLQEVLIPLAVCGAGLRVRLFGLGVELLWLLGLEVQVTRPP